MRIHIGHHAHDLGVRGRLLCQIADALPLGHHLVDPPLVRGHAVGRDLLDLPGAVAVEEVGVGLALDLAVDGQIGHAVAAVVDIDLPQGLLRGGGRRGRQGQQPQGQNDSQQER